LNSHDKASLNEVMDSVQLLSKYETFFIESARMSLEILSKGPRQRQESLTGYADGLRRANSGSGIVNELLDRIHLI
jgi:hypothetical protein